MELFGSVKTTDINQELKKYQDTANAVLPDVRSPEEYAEGHIPGSRNIPLPELPKLLSQLPDTSHPLFVYCLSGGRSKRAVSFLERAGYTSVTNIGGINSYHGEIEK